MKYKQFLFLLLFFPSALLADLNDQIMYNAYLTGDLAVWSDAINKEIKEKNSYTRKELEQLINYQFGYIGYCISEQKYDEATRHITNMERKLQLLETCKHDVALVKAYRASLCIFKMPMNKWKFISLGINGIQLADEAYRLNPSNPLIVTIKGNMDFYKPAVAGGSKKNALFHFEKAIELYKKDQMTEHNWNYMATLLNMAQAYEKTGNMQKALLICKEILEIAPNFKWVKETYYPQLLNKTKQ